MKAVQYDVKNARTSAVILLARTRHPPSVTSNPSDTSTNPQVSFEQFLLVLYVSAALIVTIQRGVYGFPSDFAIFRASFWHLISGQDLYGLRLDPLGNGFKY